jgi:nucleotide sugar dehydrogenase
MNIKDTTIGVIGMGMVGGALSRGFSWHFPVKCYDIDERKRTHTLEETLNSEIVFVCLPTPMTSATGGSCNLSIIEGFFEKAEEIKKQEDQRKDTIFVLKSTVPVGTTRKLIDKYNLDVMHSLEALTAKNNNIDAITPARQVIGGLNEVSVNKLKAVYEYRFPGCPVFCMSPEEAEYVKYICNCFFSVKVMFFNEMKLLSDKLGLSWDNLLKGVLSDGRIGLSHFLVGDKVKGVGGLCVPGTAMVKIKTVNSGEEFINISELYNRYEKSQLDKEIFMVESCDYNINKSEWKTIKIVTEREIDEDIYIFETDNGNFECTGEHLIPILRNEEKILIEAKNIKDTDLLFINT